MDIASLIPHDQVVDVLHPVTDEPTGLKLTVAPKNDRRVLDRYSVEFEGFEGTDHERNRFSVILHVVDWEWGGDTYFKEPGNKPEFSVEALKEVCKVPAVEEAIWTAVMNRAGFHTA